MKRLLYLLGFACAFAATTAQAQSAAPPHLSLLEGAATLERGQDREAAVANTPLAIGDRLRTDLGRAEVLLGDGSAMHLDERTSIDLNGDSVVRLLEGRLIVLAESSAAGILQIDSAPASVRMQSSGEVRLDLRSDGAGRSQLEVGVIRGLADVSTDQGTVPVRAGQRVLIDEGQAPSYPTYFNSAREDAFVRWSAAVLDSRRGTASAAYLPTDVRAYGPAFDQYGSWAYSAPYGYVWYPRVATGWRPYHHGRWRFSGGIGWSFVGYDPWSWATTHYGRWGISGAGAWFWIPTPGWSAAWVHWAVAPGFVGWCPLGFDNRPVLGFWGGRGLRRAGFSDPWRAWSVVSFNDFRGGHPVHRVAFDRQRFAGSRAPNFVLQPTPPASAIPRGAVVAQGYRTNGPSVAPRAGQSRRGEPIVSAGQSRRGEQAAGVSAFSRRSAPSASALAGVDAGRRSPAATPGDAAARSRIYSTARRAGPGQGTPTAAPPPVVYYRGGTVDNGRGPASAYERAGVAVPRGLPADAARPAGPRAPTVAVPYGSLPAGRYNRPSGAYERGGGPSRYGPPQSPGAPPVIAMPRGAAPPAPPRAPMPSRMSSPSPAGAPRGPSAAPRGPSGPPPSAAPPARSAPSGSNQGTAVPRHGGRGR